MRYSKQNIHTFAPPLPGACLGIARARGIHRIIQVAVPGLSLLLTACGGNMEEPIIQINPNASMRYEIVVRIEDAPGAFDSFSAAADYQVTNDMCVPLIPISGVRKTPTKRINLDLIRMGDDTYRTAVFVDQLKDDDYFGLGICHWSLVAASVSTNKGSTTFTAAIFRKDVLSQANAKTYYSKNALSGAIDILDSGSTSRTTYRDTTNTFSISMEAKESLK